VPAAQQKGPSMLNGFKQFLLRGNVIDLAVAFIIGAAFTAIVTALVQDILTPIIAMIFGKPSFDNLTFTINHSVFKYGSFLTAVINFILIAAAVYFFVVLPVQKLMELQARRRAAGEPADEATPVSDEVLILTEIRDALQARS
jgi:large conductance mechanosensitive channel